jgi:hypothetical protein
MFLVQFIVKTIISIFSIELKKSPQDEDQKLAVVNTVMNPHVWVKVGNLAQDSKGIYVY